MKPWEIDVAVLLIFFCRPEQLSIVFEEIRKAKPRTLLLYQDGPRLNRESDLIGIKACRKIVENIDWDCKVYKYYQNENIGCDPSEFIAQKWAFSIVDKCIVLEDDDVPSQSFFKFCKEMLDKYENDERINIISGMNTLEKYNHEDADYFFSSICSIWGWASWSRVVNSWEEGYKFLDDEATMKKLKQIACKNNNLDAVLSASKSHKQSSKPHYETILASNMFLNNRVNIVPSVNMISNIGIAKESTHSVDSIDKLPTGIRRVFSMKLYDLDFPLRHPNYVIEDISYAQKVCRIMGWGYPRVMIYRKIESLFIKLKSGSIKEVINSIRKRFN